MRHDEEKQRAEMQARKKAYGMFLDAGHSAEEWVALQPWIRQAWVEAVQQGWGGNDAL